MWNFGALWSVAQNTFLLALIVLALFCLKDRPLRDLLRTGIKGLQLPKGWAQRSSAGLLVLALATSALGWTGQALQYGVPAVVAMALGGPASHEIDHCHQTTPARAVSVAGTRCIYGGHVTQDTTSGKLHCSKHGDVPTQ